MAPRDAYVTQTEGRVRMGDERGQRSPSQRGDFFDLLGRTRVLWRMKAGVAGQMAQASPRNPDFIWRAGSS